MKLRNGLIGVALALIITGGSTVAANAAEPAVTAEATTPDKDAVAFTSPAPQSQVDDQRPRFTGTGKAGASVVVTDLRGTVLCAARVTGDGWSCDSVVPMGDGTVAAVATQDAWSAKTSATVYFVMKHVDKPAVPLWIFAAGGGLVLLLVAAASILVARNRRKQSTASWEQDDAATATVTLTEERKAPVT